MNLGAMMRAVRIDQAGSPDGLHLVEAPRPEPGAGDLLVRVQVAGVNYADTMIRRNQYFAPVTFPVIPGAEVAGVVEAVGPEVSGWAPGDRIAGLRLDGRGGYAEYAVVPALHAAPVPAALDLDRATAVLNQGLTAQGIIETAAEIARGASVLVTAAAGGVGGLLLQLARLGGAGTLIAAAGDISKLAPDPALDATIVSYNDPDWTRQVRAATGGRGVEVVLDAVGGAVREACPRAMVPRGRLLFYGAASGGMGVNDAVLTQVLGKTLSLTGFAIHTPIQEDEGWLRRTLERLFALAVEGRLRTPIHPPFALADAGRAHAALESRATRGKVLLHID